MRGMSRPGFLLQDSSLLKSCFTVSHRSAHFVEILQCDSLGEGGVRGTKIWGSTSDSSSIFRFEALRPQLFVCEVRTDLLENLADSKFGHFRCVLSVCSPSSPLKSKQRSLLKVSSGSDSLRVWSDETPEDATPRQKAFQRKSMRFSYGALVALTILSVVSCRPLEQNEANLPSARRP